MILFYCIQAYWNIIENAVLISTNHVVSYCDRSSREIYHFVMNKYYDRTFRRFGIHSLRSAFAGKSPWNVEAAVVSYKSSRNPKGEKERRIENGGDTNGEYVFVYVRVWVWRGTHSEQCTIVYRANIDSEDISVCSPGALYVPCIPPATTEWF